MIVKRHHIINAAVAMAILAGIAYNLPDAFSATADCVFRF